MISSTEVKSQTLISGVVDLQVQLGVDADGDQTVDRYVNPDLITDEDWENVYAAKIWLVMRSDKPQRGINTAKSFIIAGEAAVTLGGQDDFRYFMVSSVVNLRNAKQLVSQKK